MTPIVLLHGIFGYGQVGVGPFAMRYFNGIDRAITARGYPVLAPQVEPGASVARRARQCKAAIVRWLDELGRPKDRIVILAHSMGGLDARYMISRLGMARRTAALVTIATPHRGSASADALVYTPPMFNWGASLLDMMGLDTRGAEDLTTLACRRFNAEVPDSRLVRYFSISAACPADCVPPPLLPGYWILRTQEGENDAMVSVRSAVWGEHLGTWPVHHLHTINHMFPTDCVSAVGDIAPYYLQILDRLADEGLLAA